MTVARRGQRLPGLALVVICWLPLVAHGQPADVPQAAASGQSLTPDVVESILAGARPDVPATLTVANREIVVLRASVLSRSSAERVAAAHLRATQAAEGAAAISVGSRAVGAAMLITLDGRDVFAIIPADVEDLLGETLQSKTEAAVQRLQLALDETIDSRQPGVLLWGTVQALAATLAFVLLLWALNRARLMAAAVARRATERTLGSSRVADELLGVARLAQHVGRLVAVVTALTGFVLAYLWLAFVLRRFPYTRPWGESLRGFLIDRLLWIVDGIAHAMPAIFTVALIVLVTRFAIRLVYALFGGVEEGRFGVPGIYPETVAPTRKLVIGLLWLFALIVSYPYLPGSDTDAFKGVSVFAGLMITLGSSGLVNQVMSGLTVTYSRALRVGDYVRIGDNEGTVTHIGTLSTKIETVRREEVTIPNQVLVSQTVTNFSRHASTLGVYTPTAVTIGYDTPWRQVQALLLLAAERTDGLRREPPPRVLQSGLEDFYVRYTLLVALDEQNKRGVVLDGLHANIQDAFNEHGVQIMSPNYEADPAGQKIVPKEQWFAAPAKTRDRAQV